jgi:hypothetical protein
MGKMVGGRLTNHPNCMEGGNKMLRGVQPLLAEPRLEA